MYFSVQVFHFLKNIFWLCLGRRSWTWTLSSCNECKPLSSCGAWACWGAWPPGCVGFRSCGTRGQQLLPVGSRAQAQWMWYTGLVAPWQVESSQTRAWTCVAGISRWILDLWATRPPASSTSFFNYLHLSIEIIVTVLSIKSLNKFIAAYLKSLLVNPFL